MVSPQPHAITRATASPGPATGSGMSTSSNGVLAALSTNARMADSSVEHEIGGLQEQRAVDTVRMQEGGGVPHQLLDANFLHVATAAVNLERPGGNLPSRLRRHHLGQGSQRAVPALILVIGQPAGAMNVGTRRVDQHLHLYELGADAVMLDQRFAALHAQLGPLHRLAIQDRKSTRLNSSHRCISYAVFCLKK